MDVPTGTLSVISPANYKITVAGYLDENMSDRLGDLVIQNSEADQPTDTPVVILEGSLADQAALFGVLNTLNNMRLPLLTVEFTGIDNKKG